MNNLHSLEYLTICNVERKRKSLDLFSFFLVEDTHPHQIHVKYGSLGKQSINIIKISLHQSFCIQLCNWVTATATIMIGSLLQENFLFLKN